MPPRLAASRWSGRDGLALFLPLILVFGLACIQFAVIFMAFVNVQNVTRDGARWVSVHPHVIDSDTIATVKGRLPAQAQGECADDRDRASLRIAFEREVRLGETGLTLVASTYDISSHLFRPRALAGGP